MSTTVLRAALRRVAALLLLAVAAIPCGTGAHPLLDALDDGAAVRGGIEAEPPGEAIVRSPPATDYRPDLGVPAERGFAPNRADLPGARPIGEAGSPYSQLLRDLGRFQREAGEDGGSGARARRGQALYLDDAGLDPGFSPQAAYRESVLNMLRVVRDAVLDERDSATLSIAGIEFSLLRGGERRAIVVQGNEVPGAESKPVPVQEGRWRDARYHDDSALQGAAAPFGDYERYGGGVAAFQGGGFGSGASHAYPSGTRAEPAAPDQSGALRESREKLIAMLIGNVYEFLSDPLTIFVLSLAASVWLLAEAMRWYGERRRQRRLRHARRRSGRRSSGAG